MGERREWDFDMVIWEGMLIDPGRSEFETVNHIIRHAFGRILNRHVCDVARPCHALSRKGSEVGRNKRISEEDENMVF